MRARILAWIESTRSNFWALPALLAVIAVLVSLLAMEFDHSFPAEPPDWMPKLFSAGPDGARAVLSTIAGSMISVTSIVFSLTMVTLTLASSQFGPRLLRNFMSHTGSQLVLGSFTATFLYSILVLQTVTTEEATGNVPRLSVSLALLLTILCVALLIYFIHHVSVSIQADEVVARVSRDLQSRLEDLLPDPGETEEGEGMDDAPHWPEGEPDMVVSAGTSGYVQAVDFKELSNFAEKNDLVIRLLRRTGEFVQPSTLAAQIWRSKATECDDEKCQKIVRLALATGDHRLPAEDVEYGISQLVEVAVRALSPGINDPFTAIRCIDRLGAALAFIAARPEERSWVPAKETKKDSETKGDKSPGQVRVFLNTSNFAGRVKAAFAQIRQNATSTPPVLIRMVEVLTEVCRATKDPDRQQTLREEAELILEAGQKGFSQQSDFRDLEERVREMEKLVG